MVVRWLSGRKVRRVSPNIGGWLLTGIPGGSSRPAGVGKRSMRHKRRVSGSRETSMGSAVMQGFKPTACRV